MPCARRKNGIVLCPMAISKKLDSFVIRDSFGLSEDQIFEEAQASAIRRSEMMKWTDISVVRSSKATFTDGDFTCFAFDLFGIGLGSQFEGGESTKTAGSVGLPKVAARGVDL